MKKQMLFRVAAVVAALAITGCGNLLDPAAGGSLTVNVGDAVSRTLLPALSMEAASYTVSGLGPEGASFSVSASGGTATLTELAFGEWVVTVDAYNAEGMLIGSGQATATVHTGQTTTVAVTVVPLSGSGTLSLTVGWSVAQVETPAILASLIYPEGTSTSLGFTVAGSAASYTSSTVPTGYQTLTVQLLDSGIPVMGAVEVVRIVKDQTTTGVYSFTVVNEPGGSIQVNIDPELADPIPVSISGVPSTLEGGSSVTASATVGDGTSGVVYVWYVNGVSQGTGSSYSVGGGLAVGYYRLDVTAFSADGTRAGSATATFQVTVGGSSAGSGIISRVAGTGVMGFSGDGGPATLAQLVGPTALAFDAVGNLFIVDYASARIRKVDTSGIITTVAGNGTTGYSGDGGPATAAQLREPTGVAVDASGNLYISEYGNHRIRKVDGSGTITTIAGTGVAGYAGDGGPATTASLSGPGNVVLGPAGALYIADSNNDRIRVVDASGIITTVAGVGTSGYSGDGGPAASAQLDSPTGIVLDSTAALVFADTYNNRIRRVSATGIITTIAGTGVAGYSGDGGPATSAEFRWPTHIVLDTYGNLLIADYLNHAVRRLDPSGVIVTIAGDGTAGYTGDGAAATSARLNSPIAITLDSSGDLYIADTYNSVVRKVSL